MKKTLVLIFAFLLVGVAARAAVVPTNNTFVSFSSGHVPTAGEWAAEVTNIYTWVNTNIVAPFNTLTTKADTYIYNNGSGLGRLAVGSNSTIMTSNGTAPTWAAATAQDIGARTKGTIVVCDGTQLQFPAPGANGTILQADSTQANGLYWASIQTNFPSGSIFPWSPSKAGTNTIPSGFALCDGTNGAPNLIGMFVIGGKPTGSSASASPYGFGGATANMLGTGAKTHAHGVGFASSNPITTSTDNTANANPSLGASSYSYLKNPHAHTVNLSNTNSNTSTLQPANYVLCYIIKQ